MNIWCVSFLLLLSPLSLCGAALGLHYGRDGELTQYAAFEEWLGRALAYRVTFADKQTWNDVRNPWPVASGATKRWLEGDPMRREVLTVPLRIAAGTFAENRDGDFEALGAKLKPFVGRVIVRLGWEANGNWYPWNYQTDPPGYKAAFRAAVIAIRRQAPLVLVDWNVSFRQTKVDWRLGYPGDDVVDIISMDVYDYVASWADLRDGVCGLQELRTFAAERGKAEAFPEWGVHRAGGGDSPAFVRNMHSWIQAGSVLYQAYWNHSDVGAAIFGTVDAPLAAAEYRKLFGSPLSPVNLVAEE